MRIPFPWDKLKGMKRTIGNLAREAGIPVSTLRYYERAGLMKPGGRTGSNYRLYGPEDLDRLRFIKASQAAGFTIADIKSLLSYRDGLSIPCRDVRLLIEQRLDHVRQKLAAMRHVERVLRSFAAECLEAERAEECQVIRRLEPSRSPGRRELRGKR